MNDPKLKALIAELDEVLDKAKLRGATGRHPKLQGPWLRNQIAEILDKYRDNVIID